MIQAHPELTQAEYTVLLDIQNRKATLKAEIERIRFEIECVTNDMAKLESSTRGTHGNGGQDGESQTRLRLKTQGRKMFNLDPKKGIKHLIDTGLVEKTPEAVADFLFNGEGLSKKSIGDYLGEKEEFNEAVLHAFINLHEFKNLILVQALRRFLFTFRLPGESQKIDRMMQEFANHYCDQNPGVFEAPDQCYILSFAVIMLNTMLHNPSIKDKPSIDDFVKMVSDSPYAYDRNMLAPIFENIRAEPFKIPEDDGNDLMHTFFNPDREGWLWKQGGRVKSWKRRWFILSDKCLYYFEYTTDREPRGIIPLENVSVRDATDRSNRQHCFELFAVGGSCIKACKTDSDGKVVEGKHSIYRMSASTAEEKDEWMRCIERSTMQHPFYNMLARKKKLQDSQGHNHRNQAQ
ncbi:cytohesin-2 [Galendromus occidentalis]|uniref:Cytohesin-2 n=1 Tax=Galendromus occidentalis TaxID=34638 RepID=A0AAJ6QK38_9ACAR|nr:cytohesin-2 [Galendromus occidentalis]